MKQTIARIEPLVNGIVEEYAGGPGQEPEISEVERHVLSMVMEIGRAALEECVPGKGTGYSGPELVDEHGTLYAYLRERSH